MAQASDDHLNAFAFPFDFVLALLTALHALVLFPSARSVRAGGF